MTNVNLSIVIYSVAQMKGFEDKKFKDVPNERVPSFLATKTIYLLVFFFLLEFNHNS